MGYGRNGSADLNVCARTHTGCGAATWLEREESLESAALSVNGTLSKESLESAALFVECAVS